MPYIAFVFILVSWIDLVAAQNPNYADATALINSQKPNIDYMTLCQDPIFSGVDKIACRIADYPSTGFLVCKNSETLEDDIIIPCVDVILPEIQNLQKVQNGGVRTVDFDSKPITDVTCGVEVSDDCTGYLVGWVDDDVGLFIQLRDQIENGTINDVIDWVRTFTEGDTQLQETAKDLSNILSFMSSIIPVKPEPKMYQQICDIQGFFLKEGGFLINDIPSIKEKNLTEPCFDGEPTTEQVINALEDLINDFGPPPISNNTVWTKTVPWILGTLGISIAVLISGKFIHKKYKIKKIADEMQDL